MFTALGLASFLPLLPCLLPAYGAPQPIAFTAGSGTFTLTSPERCILLAELTSDLSSTTPTSTLNAFHPICPASNSTYQHVSFPFTQAGSQLDSSAAPDLLIYGGFKTSPDAEGAYTAAAQCVTHVTNSMVGLLYGGTLKWSSAKEELYDVGAKGWFDSGHLPCSADATLLPSGLLLPDPCSLPATAKEWSIPIELTSTGGKIERDVQG